MRSSRRFTIPAALLVGAAPGLIGLKSDPVQFRGASVRQKAATPIAGSYAQPGAGGASVDRESEASAGAFAYAWNSLKDGQLPKQERIALQSAIIREWSLVDLPAAIRAVTADQFVGFWGVGVEDPLRKALRSGIAAQPELAWHLIETHGFGLHTKWLREAWIQEVGRQNPKRLMERCAGFSSYDRSVAMSLAVETANAPGKPQTDLDQVVGAVLPLPTAPGRPPPIQDLIGILGSTVEHPELLERARNTQEPSIRRVFLEAYLGITNGPIELEGEPQWKSDLTSLPPKIREEAEQILKKISRR